MRRVREKALKALTTPSIGMNTLPDSALLEALRLAYGAQSTYGMAGAVRELFERANARGARDPLEPSFKRIEPVTVAKNDDTAPAPEPVTVAETKPAKPTEPPSNARGYPPEVKARAVALADAGTPTREIHAAIMAECGRSPDSSNLARLIRQWRAAMTD